jgi:hypothetical protein
VSVVVPPLSHRTHLAAVSWLTGWTLAEIDRLFCGNELPAPVETLDEARWPVGSSVRRSQAARYLSAVDGNDPLMRVRLLRAYSEILARTDTSYPTDLANALKADGVRFQESQIDPSRLQLPARGVVSHMALAGVRDPGILRSHARRMQQALDGSDPEDAILAGRELIESVCHMVIEAHGETAAKNPSLGALYGQAADLLGLRADAVSGDSEASKAAKQVLGGLMSIAKRDGRAAHPDRSRARAQQRQPGPTASRRTGDQRGGHPIAVHPRHLAGARCSRCQACRLRPPVGELLAAGPLRLDRVELGNNAIRRASS